MEPEENEYTRKKSSKQNISPLKNIKFTLTDIEGNGKLNKLADKIVILLIGQTGVGKSTLGNKIAYLLGSSTYQFEESQSQKSCTQECSMYENDKYVVIDTPGLFDTTDKKDEENVR